MKAVLQRVECASVSVDGEVVGEIGRGYLILLGVGLADTERTADALLAKIEKLRVFPHAQGKTNLSIQDIGGEVLVVSQFTLYADCRKGNRPSFTGAGGPVQAEALYDYFTRKAEQVFKKVARGRFGAHMTVALVNDGPFTVVLEVT